MKLAKQLLKIVGDWLWPRRCAGCGRSGFDLCLTCQEKLAVGIVKRQDGNLVALSYGDELVKNLIWQLKYRQREGLGRILGELAAKPLAEYLAHWPEPVANEKILVAPIPLAKAHRRRWFNQAAVIARAVAASDETRFEFCPRLFVVTRRTQSQVSLPRRERLTNLIGAFAVKQKVSVKNRSVIVVDDVVTTGATLGEARRALAAAGARRALGLAVAGGSILW